MSTKENLINSITLSIITKNDYTVPGIKRVLEEELSKYAITEIRETLPASTSGEATAYLMRKFAEAKTAAGMRKESLAQYLLTVKKFYNTEKVDLNLATADNINHFLAYMRNVEKLQDNTIKGNYLKLSSIFGFLFGHKYIADNPMLEIEPPKAKIKVKKPLKESEIEQIKMACEQEGKKAAQSLAMIYFFLDTGVRVTEFCNVNMKDVDFEKMTVHVVNGKGGKDRTVYFTEKTKVRLMDYLASRTDIQFTNFGITYEENTPLFISHLEKKYGKSGIEAKMRKLAEKSGILRLRPHLLRATFATELAERGVGIEVIAKLLGHANLHTINRYILLSDDRIKMMIKNAA